MMLDVRSELQSPSATGLAMLVLAAAAATILGALAFQHIGGYDPCALCLQQRYAYYLGIPATLLALLLLRGSRKVAAALLLAVALGFAVNAAIGVYQAGAEWKFWDPPSTCASAGDLPSFDSSSLSMERKPALCGVASWRDPVLRLSFAGWNALISAGLAGVGLTAALKAIRKPA